jgi:uncharacterized membrane protein
MAGEFIAGGRAVAAGRGWDWIAGSWALFKKQPGMWILLFVLLFVAFAAMGLVPFAGSIATFVLSPVLGAGVFVAGRAAHEGRALEVGQLLAGFRERFGTLAAVGGIYLGAAVVIALAVGLAIGVHVWSMMGGTMPDTSTPAAALTVILGLLIMLALLLPVMMAVWFAPALVLFHGRGALEAMQDSFIGCLKNIVPMVVYGAVALVLGVLASIPFGLGWLVLGPVLMASLYDSYRDIFIAP